jgi:FtsP/CotA-like multicopper oxidase with cupredoxin domain
VKIMEIKKSYYLPLLMLLLLFGSVLRSEAAVDIQCPCDYNNDGDCEDSAAEIAAQTDLASTVGGKVTCMHLGAGDGFARMADGRPMYLFGFSDLTGIPSGEVMDSGILAQQWPAPTIAVNQGDDFYLSLTNVGMLMRPDLFDPHTVHFHGFPQSSTVFDGLPESGIAINMGATLTYYYKLVGPGTFMYHCHVEATEHMQMGMLGNLYVRAAQSWLGAPGVPAGDLAECNVPGDQFPNMPCGYAYNDGDGTTAYDEEFALQLGGWDPDFHDASWNVQPLPFAMMWDRYPFINGRGYPDTVYPGIMDQPNQQPLDPDDNSDLNGPDINSQQASSLITAVAGERILLRLSNLNITVQHTLISPSIPMTVVGIDAKELRSSDGTTPLHYTTNSVTMGGGMSADVILDTTGIAPGTYFLYAANLQYLSNLDEDFGGMMTEIRIQ